MSLGCPGEPEPQRTQRDSPSETLELWMRPIHLGDLIGMVAGQASVRVTPAGLGPEHLRISGAPTDSARGYHSESMSVGQPTSLRRFRETGTRKYHNKTIQSKEQFAASDLEIEARLRQADPHFVSVRGNSSSTA